MIEFIYTRRIRHNGLWGQRVANRCMLLSFPRHANPNANIKETKMSDNHFGYIYKTTNTHNGLIYVGQHKWDRNCIDKNYIGSGKCLMRAVNKHGRENFRCEILEWADSPEELDDKERYWIKELNSTDNTVGYNLQHGGRRPECDRISAGLKNYYNSLTDEQKLQCRLRVSGERNGMYGKHHTDETKRLWKERHRGERKHSDETKRK